MTCGQHSDTTTFDPTCEECFLDDRAAQWIEWLDVRIAQLDEQVASTAEQLEIATATRDELADAREHHRMTTPEFTEMIRPFLQPTVPVRSDEAPIRTSSEGAPVERFVPPPRPSLSPAVILSAAGATLVLVAAVVFTAVSWNRLGRGGQAAMMVTATLLVTVIAVVCQRRRLRWTAEALSWLAAALAAVDVVAAAHYDLMLGDAAPEIVVAASSGAVLLVGLLIASATNHTSGAAVAAPAGASSDGRLPERSVTEALRDHVGGHTLVAPWVQGPLAIVVAAGALAIRLGELRWAPVTAAVAAIVVVGSLGVRSALRRWWAAPALLALAVSAVVSLQQIDGTAEPLIYAVTVGLLVLALGSWAYRIRSDPRSVPLGSIASLLMMFAVPALHVSRCDHRAQIVIVGVLSVSAVAASFAPRADARRALAVASAAPLVGTAAAMLDRSSTGTAALVGGLLVALAWLRHDDGRLASTVVLTTTTLALCAYAPAAVGLGIGWSAMIAVLVAVLVTDCLVVLSDRSDGASEPGTTRTGWVPRLAVGPLAVSLAAMLVATVAASETIVALVIANFAIAVGAAIVVSLVRRPSVRRVGLVAVMVGWAVGWVTLMAHLDTSVPEYTWLAVAVVWLGVGATALRLEPQLTSWAALSPGLLAASLPSMAIIVVGDDGLTRMFAMVGAGALVAILGAARRLQAPLVLGAVASVFAALTQTAPWVAALPRWLSLGAAGVALLVAGARFESVRSGVHRAASGLGRLR